MVRNASGLVRLLKHVDAAPLPPETALGRGRPQTHSEKLVAKALVVMIVGRLYSPHALLAFLDQDDVVVARVRPLLREHGRTPSRRTWERRLKAFPDDLPRLIGALGAYLAALLKPWGRDKRAVAFDSTALRTSGGCWHRKHREAGEVPHTSIDPDAGWSRSGWHGWGYGWKLHVSVTAGKRWIPLAAELRPANTSDNVAAPSLLAYLPQMVRWVLGDRQ